MMRVKGFSLPPSCLVRIKKTAKKLGISESEVVRRAVDEYAAKLGLLGGDSENDA